MSTPARTHARSPFRPALLVALALTAGGAGAQSFVDNTTDVPQGSPANNSFTENVTFFDADGDGDWDAVWADGGDAGNDRNRVWINQGGLQGGTTGVFVDETSTRWPGVTDDSRDVELADIDADGDVDVLVCNTSDVSNQPNRWMVNMGGVQGGTAGFFQEQTLARWVSIGVNDGTTSSSVAPSVALPGGGFIDWTCNVVFADLDNDGDKDLVNASYGALSNSGPPTRIFLNDGAGYFEEFNPSGHQLSGTDINDGDPAVWAEGTHLAGSTDATGTTCDVAEISISVEAGDLDGDFDVDILLGEKFDAPRIFTNRLEETGGLAFRDVSFAVLPANWSPGLGSYEQDLADFDNDDDLDIYGTNWNVVCDREFRNNGDGTFGPNTILPGSCQRHNEPDFIDYDGDGDLDVFISSEFNIERIYENPGAGGGWVLADTAGAELPASTITALGAEVADVDGDGDYDLFVCGDLAEPNDYFENVTQVADTTAPRISHVEQAPDRAAGYPRTVIRAHVYDNAEWYHTLFNTTVLEYSVNSGPFFGIAMTPSGGQVYRGEIPGLIEGTIDYRVRSTDEQGNVGVSTTKSFTAGPCDGDPLVYCTAKVNSQGCSPMIGVTGAPSASQPTGFSITCSNTLNQKSGLLFYGYTPKQVMFQGGYLCVQAPVKRTQLQNSGGNPPPNDCSGFFSYDFNARIASGVDTNLTAGTTVYAQYWSRDPQSSFNTNRSDAVQFTICP